MTKVEMANKVYEWLKSDEKLIIMSNDDNIGKRIVMFIKVPCTQKGYEDVVMVISGDITYMEDWRSTENFGRVGFWIAERELLLEDRVHSYNFCEVNPHFVSEGDLIQKIKEISKEDIFDWYHTKYPTYESLGLSLDDSDTVKALRYQFMDRDWLNGTTPVSVWDYFERNANICWGLCNITTEMCIRYFNGEPDIFRDLFVAPFLDENCTEMKQKIEDVKVALASAYTHEIMKEHYKPSARALATKKIVDAVKKFLSDNKDKSIQNFKVTGEFEENHIATVSVRVSNLNNYDSAYDFIDTYWKECKEKNYSVRENLLADKVVKITYGRKVIYSRDE